VSFQQRDSCLLSCCSCTFSQLRSIGGFKRTSGCNFLSSHDDCEESILESTWRARRTCYHL